MNPGIKNIQHYILDGVDDLTCGTSVNPETMEFFPEFSYAFSQSITAFSQSILNPV